MAMALETGVATPASTYAIPNTYTTPNGQTFQDSHSHGTMQLTLTGILANSLNTGTVMVASQVPKDIRHEYFNRFGVGSSTGVELPEESSGYIADADDWDGRTQYTVLFGQGLSVTALQMTGIYATIANDGVSMPLHLVKGYADADGTEQSQENQTGTQVVSPETAHHLMNMLETVVDDGTGTSAAIDGYRVVGKTGTAEIAGANGELSSHMSSFIGVVPADNPQWAISVMLLDPQTSIYGGVVAAPVFKDIATYALQRAGIPPSTGTPAGYPLNW
jgi:cell division protein FtsI (penicillin-binding protein 3)